MTCSRRSRSSNVNLPTGTLYGEHQAFTVQATGQLLTARDLPPDHRRLPQREPSSTGCNSGA